MHPAEQTETASLLDKSRFVRLWRQLAAYFDQPYCEGVFDELKELYGGHNRYYHSDAHIHHCLSKLDESVSNPELAPHVEMAIWFHDVIYTAGDPLNEQNSADWFRKLATNHLSKQDVDRVTNLITITEHRHVPSNADEKLMVDIDLSSFGFPETQFIEDGRSIRQEFSDIPDGEFIAGQIVFLNRLLERPALYSTEYFQENYEDTARKNIGALLQIYQSGKIQ